ncbi:Scr1 family TA system antitoxin-like transcriptional regulator [Streptomyces sp. NPDC088925]|uniref:helix-turn-helix domain-containing protein n=1 Tax=Streptomyces sp. NPDC088925 TaxID=3365914 RepID=UPI0038271851
MASKRAPAHKSLYRRQLAKKLMGARRAAGLTQAEAARAVEMASASLSKIENAERGTTVVLARALLDAYGVTVEAEREEILDLVRADQAHRHQWWRDSASYLNMTRAGLYLGLEGDAEWLHNWEPDLIPGLLQTEDYAREVLTAMRPDLDAEGVEVLVRVRVGRRRILERENPATLHAIIDEGAVRRLAPTPKILTGQVRHLLAVSALPHVTVQVLPFEAGLHPGLDGSFVLMGFPEDAPAIAWVENGPNSVHYEGTQDVGRYTEIFADLRAQALDPDRTEAWLTNVIKES